MSERQPVPNRTLTLHVYMFAMAESTLRDNATPNNDDTKGARLRQI